jgi:uncharacterized protein YegL
MSDFPAPKARVYPVYVVCDVSRSTWDPQLCAGREDTPMDVMEDALIDILRTLEDDPMAVDTAYLSVIAFGDSPVDVLPLTSMYDEPAVPALPRHLSANYADVLRYLDWQLRGDHRRLHSADLGVYTPLVLFIVHADPHINGVPQRMSDWLPLRQALGSPDHPMRPDIVAFGMGTASEDTVKALASAPEAAFIGDGTALPGDVLRAFRRRSSYS